MLPLTLAINRPKARPRRGERVIATVRGSKGAGPGGEDLRGAHAGWDWVDGLKTAAYFSRGILTAFRPDFLCGMRGWSWGEMGAILRQPSRRSQLLGWAAGLR